MAEALALIRNDILHLVSGFVHDAIYEALLEVTYPRSVANLVKSLFLTMGIWVCFIKVGL